MARQFLVIRLATGALGAALVLAGCVDETHELQVQALGGETSGVPRGPLHRPGQPCLVCHGGEGPASSTFLMAGTVYAVQDEPAPAVGASVQIEDINGSFYTLSTNAAGNFFIRPSDWSLTYPAQAQVTLGSSIQLMGTHINRDGSCADCHALTPSPTSPGRVFAALAPAEGGQ